MARRTASAIAFLLALGCALWSPRAAAQCVLQTVQPMTFTGYAPWGPAVAATADIRYHCAGPAQGRRLGLSISNPRTMAGPDPLAFEIYPPASTTPFPETPPLPVAWTGGARVTVQGSLGAPQEAAPGTYQTTLRVTLYIDGIAVSAGNLVVSTVVARRCAIYPATLAFGVYDPIGPNATAPRTAQTAVEIQCTRTTSYWLTLDGGGSFGARRQMGNGAGAWLGYDLFSDAARSVPWLPGATPPGMPVAAPSIARVAIPVYGLIPPAQPVPNGAYQDVVLSTINF